MNKNQLKIIFLALLFFPILFFSACSGDDVNETDVPRDDKLEIDVSQLSIEANGGSLYISGSSNIAWSARSENSWLSIKPENGLAGKITITVNVAGNDDLSSRHGCISIMAGKIEKKVNISQSGVVPVPDAKLEVNLDDDSEFGNEAKNIDVKINSSSDWTAYIEAPWLTIEPAGGAAGMSDIVLSLSENFSAVAREATLIIENKELKSSKYIKQLGVAETVITVGKTEFDSDGGIVEVKVNTVDELDYHIPADCNWIELVSAADGIMEFMISANTSALSRTATLKAGTVCRIIDVEIGQRGVAETKITVSRTDFSADGGTFDVKVNTTDALTYEIEADCAWISLIKTDDEAAAISFRVERNLSPDSRCASLRAGTIHKTIDIRICQSGMSGGNGDIEDMPVIPLGK